MPVEFMRIKMTEVITIETKYSNKNRHLWKAVIKILKFEFYFKGLVLKLTHSFTMHPLSNP